MNLTSLNPTSKEPLGSWLRHIKRACRRNIKPDYSEVKSPFRIDWALYGRYLDAKKAI
jgi:hypothetical protein